MVEKPKISKQQGPQYPLDAPINRPRELRQEIDTFRNTRVIVPGSALGALAMTVDALEFYEHAIEWALETSLAYAAWCLGEDAQRELVLGALMGADVDGMAPVNLGDVAKVKSRSAAKDIADTTPHMRDFLGRKHQLAFDKAAAEKEVSVARRRHATALAAVFVAQHDGAAKSDMTLQLSTMGDLVAKHAAQQLVTDRPVPEHGDTEAGFASQP